MGKLSIGCFSSLIGSMTLDFAVKLAEAARKKGHDVDIWLSGNGTMLSKKGQRKFQDYSSLEKPVTDLIKGGLTMVACEACAEARGQHKEDLLEGCDRKSMDWYLASCFKADRVIHIGGE
ncbi:MAG: DsrE family protein [Candidatus Magnetoovum sp. WYHC-5]|nr:DsrE family protein [Candidatus Magnetoovum sp. WYHC-5]